VINSEQIIGLCINTIPVRLKITPNTTFLGLAQHLQNGFWESYEHQHISLADIQATTALKSNLISHLFIFENYPISENLSKYQNGIISDISVTEFNNYGLYITAYSNEQGILLDFEYNSGSYTKEFITAMSCRFQEILSKVLKANESHINYLLSIPVTEIKDTLLSKPFVPDEIIMENQDNLISELKLIWEKILEQNDINVNDNYFDIGGHSLNLVRLFTLIDEQFPNTIKIPELFDNPTIILQANLIRAKTKQENKGIESELTVLDF
jgi:Condensation domain/Phosphopantetheine attachment site